MGTVWYVEFFLVLVVWYVELKCDHHNVACYNKKTVLDVYQIAKMPHFLIFKCCCNRTPKVLWLAYVCWQLVQKIVSVETNLDIKSPVTAQCHVNKFISSFSLFFFPCSFEWGGAQRMWEMFYQSYDNLVVANQLICLSVTSFYVLTCQHATSPTSYIFVLMKELRL